MKKMYYSRPLPLAALPVLAALPFLGAALRGSLDAYVFAEAALAFAIALGLYFLARRKVAAVEGGKLRLLSGIGLAEEDAIELSSISAVERQRPWYMTIRYGEGKALGLEADKAALNVIAKDLVIFAGKKADAAARP